MPTTPETSALDQLAALRKIVLILDKLDDASRRVSVTWLAGRYLPDQEDERG